jgi:DNA-binding protein
MPAGFIQRVPEPKTTKNRIHPDIEVVDMEVATSEIERLGGRRRRTVKGSGGIDAELGDTCG